MIWEGYYSTLNNKAKLCLILLNLNKIRQHTCSHHGISCTRRKCWWELSGFYCFCIVIVAIFNYVFLVVNCNNTHCYYSCSSGLQLINILSSASLRNDTVRNDNILYKTSLAVKRIVQTHFHQTYNLTNELFLRLSWIILLINSIIIYAGYGEQYCGEIVTISNLTQEHWNLLGTGHITWIFVSTYCHAIDFWVWLTKMKYIIKKHYIINFRQNKYIWSWSIWMH